MQVSPALRRAVREFERATRLHEVRGQYEPMEILEIEGIFSKTRKRFLARLAGLETGLTKRVYSTAQPTSKTVRLIKAAKLKKCHKCGGKRVYLESPAEGYTCPDCGASDSDE